jgi:hypothetical protein
MGELLLRLLRFIPSAPFQDKLTQPGKFQIPKTNLLLGNLNVRMKYIFIFLPLQNSYF